MMKNPQITVINPVYHSNLLKCSDVDFKDREMVSFCTESTPAKEFRNTIPGRKRKKLRGGKKKKKGRKACKNFLLLKKNLAYFELVCLVYIRKYQ